MEFTGFVGPTYTLQSVIADCQRCVNQFPEVNEVGAGKERRIARFVPTPGLLLVVNAGTGPIRGMWTAGNGRVFFVSGNQLFELTAGDVATPRGVIDSATGRVEMADNGTQLLIVTSGTGYVFTMATNVLAAIDPAQAFPVGATSAAFLDQYLIVDDPTTGNFQLSNLADATLWDGLDVANPEGSPDKLQTLVVDHRELILFSTQTTEVWFNSGDATFPLSRREGSFIEVGIAGRGLKARADQGVLFWGRDKNGGVMAYRITGSSASRISTFAIEQAIAKLGDISAGTCYSYQKNGHTFWCTNFPGSDSTWVYDVATGLWHERQTAAARNRAENHCFDGLRNLVGDFENGNIYQLSDTKYTDNGDYIARIRRAPHFSQENKRITYNSLLLDVEVGVGNAVDPGQDPQVICRYSDDGAKTWSNEISISLGKVGEYLTQVEFRRLGMARDRVFEIKFTDPCPFYLNGAFLDVRGSNS